MYLYVYINFSIFKLIKLIFFVINFNRFVYMICGNLFIMLTLLFFFCLSKCFELNRGLNNKIRFYIEFFIIFLVNLEEKNSINMRENFIFKLVFS